MMISMREIVQKLYQQFAIRNGFKKAWIEKHWLELVGLEAGKHSRPHRVEHEVLFVNVDSSVWNQELFMTRRNLIQKINGNFSQVIIREIKYQIGHFATEEGRPPVGEVSLPQPDELQEKSRGGSFWDEIVLHGLQKKRHRE